MSYYCKDCGSDAINVKQDITAVYSSDSMHPVTYRANRQKLQCSNCEGYNIVAMALIAVEIIEFLEGS